ncbi:IS110 family transposase [Salicibibacter halophilus]|uniref:IS110 family transposase n=1 Tax=Salicibibacter halophilus TaxID=2502791 RepID=A0A514LHE2_9BACI|nr:IS110 family transposase [Salicibibacter halophilus]QDI90701.1 IS110 family transposase [Salicibibacter halophilus]
MKDNTKFVGLDVSKERISVAIAEVGRGMPRYYGVIPNTPEAIRQLIKKLGNTENLQVCYEAGVTGYGLYRLFLKLGIECEVIAPGLIPQRPGDRVKTDKRDAIRLAQLFRAGELTSVYVPTEEDEALRDLVRAREDAKEDELRAKHRITKLLLRYSISPPKEVGKNWSYKYRKWIQTLTFKHSALSVAFQEYLQHINEIEERVKRLEKEIEQQSTQGVHAPMIQALQCLRGVALITATSLVAEIGSFQRFQSPKQLMAYTGLVPSESSSGDLRKQGSITKTGNRHVRRLLIESSWSYRYQPAVKGKLKKRIDGQPGSIQTISWNAQQRLHKKYFRLLLKGKSSGTAVTAVARELAGFVWAVAQEADEQTTSKN